MSDLLTAGLGYTLASGRLFCDFGDFQLWCERLLDRPIFTHEFALPELTEELKAAFEERARAELAAARSGVDVASGE